MYLTRTIQYPISLYWRKEENKIIEISSVYKGLIVFFLLYQSSSSSSISQPPGNRAHLVSSYKSQWTIFFEANRGVQWSRLYSYEGASECQRKVCTSVPYHPRCNIVHIDPISIRVSRIAKNNPDLLGDL